MKENLKVVVVDSNPSDLVVLQNLVVSEIKLNVLLYNEFDTAMAYIKENIKDIVVLILDFHLEKLNGQEALKIIRSVYTEQELPVIFLTGKSFSLEQFIEVKELGATDILEKDLVKDTVALNLLKNRLALYLKFYSVKKIAIDSKDGLKKYLSGFLDK